MPTSHLTARFQPKAVGGDFCILSLLISSGLEVANWSVPELLGPFDGKGHW